VIVSPDSRRTPALVAWAALLPVLWLGACNQPSSEGTDAEGDAPDRVLVRVDGEDIRESAVDARLRRIPLLARGEYSGPVGKNRLLRQMIEEEILTRAALDSGVDRDPEVAADLEAQRRQILTQAYLDKQLEESRNIPEEVARAFFEEHRDEYLVEETRAVRVLVNPDENVVRETRRAVLEDGVPFASLCAVRNVNPNLLESAGMLPERVRRGRAVPWLGNSHKFHEEVFSLQQGELSEVFETAHGFNLVMVEQVREARERPFEEVQSDVYGRIRRARSTQAVPDLIDSLEAKYHVEYLELPGPSAEELFALAQGAPNPQAKVAHFEEFVQLYPEDPRVLDALFMIGFTRSEELHDEEGARTAFQRVIEEFPDSELAQSARWMLSSEGSEVPALGNEGTKSRE